MRHVFLKYLAAVSNNYSISTACDYHESNTPKLIPFPLLPLPLTLLLLPLRHTFSNTIYYHTNTHINRQQPVVVAA